MIWSEVQPELAVDRLPLNTKHQLGWVNAQFPEVQIHLEGSTKKELTYKS